MVVYFGANAVPCLPPLHGLVDWRVTDWFRVRVRTEMSFECVTCELLCNGERLLAPIAYTENSFCDLVCA